MFQNICTHSILFVQVFRWPKKGPLLIYTFRPLRDSKEPKTKENKNQFLRGFFWKIPFLYFLLHKSCIWRTLGHVMDIFLIAIFILFQKNVFSQIQISCMGSKVPYWKIFKNCRNGTFEPLNEIWIFLAKGIPLKHYEHGNKKEYP